MFELRIIADPSSSTQKVLRLKKFNEIINNKIQNLKKSIKKQALSNAAVV